jgi:nucleoid-associated protein YgaU
MGKDFRVGLMTGVVLAGAALIWVATRPSLSPQARVTGAGHASPARGAEEAANPPLPWETAETVEVAGPQTGSQESRDLQPQGQPPFSPPLVPSDPAPISSPLPLPTGGGTQAAAWVGDLTIYETTEPIKTTRFHIVRKGETLSSIAAQYLGSPDKWHKLVETNQKTSKDPDKIAPGTKLIIPD